MGTEKRERQKANRAAKIEQERAAEARRKRNQTIKTLVIMGLVLVIGMFLISQLTGCAKSDGTSDGATATTKPSTTKTKAAACPTSDNGKTAVIDFDSPPTAGIEKGDPVTATVTTSEGTVVLKLDTERAPKTVDNFVALARNCYFDGTKLFRTEAQTGIIQGGSPHTQDNTDTGPGYTIPDEGGPYKAADYAPGTIAMANTGSPNSGSAQFFFLANEGGRYLGDSSAIGPSAGSYTVFGKATEGADVLKAIAKLDDGTSAPSKPVTIESVTIKAS